MRLLEFFEKTRVRLDEFRLRTDKPKSKSYDVFVAGPYLWVFDSEDSEKETLENLNDLEKTLNVETGFFGLETVGDLAELTERYPQFFYGVIYQDELLLNDLSDLSHHPSSSPLIKKLVKRLGIKRVVISDDEDSSRDYYMMPSQLLGNLPDVALHGTNTRHINSILRKGLSPENSHTNWPEVGKFPLVFLTLKFSKAAFHAFQSAGTDVPPSYRKKPIPYDVFPVILKVKIPDKNRVVLDYDVASMLNPEHPDAERSQYFKSASFGRQSRDFEPSPIKIKDLNKMTGVFAYNGRIPASHIVSILADFSEDQSVSQPSFHEFDNIRDFLSAYEIAQDYGFWVPGMEKELEAMRQEDEEDEY